MKRGSNLVFLIDTSGSMESSDKLPLLQQAFSMLAGNLSGKDRISIVTYASLERIVLSGCSGSDATRMIRVIRSLEADGSTNGEAGFEAAYKTAYKTAQESFIDGGVNRIIMASDGDLNVGMSSESALLDYVDQKRETGIYLSVLGFGAGNYKDNKMETLADHGNFHYIDSADEAEKVLVDDMAANLVPLTGDVKIQVEFNPAEVKGYHLIGYENRAMADEEFENDSADAGDIGPNAQFTVAYEIVPVGSDFEIGASNLKHQGASTGTAMPDEWLTCAMRYKPVGESAVREQRAVVSSNDLAVSPSDDRKFAAAVIEFGMVLRDSEQRGTATLDTARELLDESHPNAKRRELGELINQAQSLK